MEIYKKHVEYHFEVCGELVALTVSNKNSCYVEEVRKNGQEDTHMSGDPVRNIQGKMEWEDGEETFSRYHSKKLADGIQKYVNKHGLPKK